MNPQPRDHGSAPAHLSAPAARDHEPDPSDPSTPDPVPRRPQPSGPEPVPPKPIPRPVPPTSGRGC